MNNYYHIKSQVQLENGEVVPVLKPDHVSLGKCVIGHQFIRKFGTINDAAVVNMLRDGCKFIGFKKIIIETSEEEGFVNMHHVLLLRSVDDDFSKEVCVRRVNGLTIRMDNLKIKNEVVTDSYTVTLFIYNRENFIDVFFFGKKKD